MNYPKWNSSNRSTNQSHLSLQLTVPFLFILLAFNSTTHDYLILFVSSPSSTIHPPPFLNIYILISLHLANNVLFTSLQIFSSHHQGARGY